MNEKRQIGLRLRELRKKHGYSQEKAAELADIASNYLSGIERGKENPTVDVFMKLAHAYKVELWELLDYGHEMSRKEMETKICSISKSAKNEDLRLIIKFYNALAR